MFLLPTGVLGVTRPPVSPPALPTPTPHTYPLKPNSLQIPVLYVAVIFLVMDIALWHLPGARIVIGPFKLFAIGWYV